jgi:hypothetical protein
VRLRRIALTSLMGLAALNIWTGAPAIALWAGSQVQGSGPPTMTGVFVVVIVFAVLAYSLAAAMTRISQAHNAITGHQAQASQHVPWLRSLRGEAPMYPGEQPRLSGPERIVVVMVVAVIIIFEVWFFFFSGSPVDQRSGRVSVPETVSQLHAEVVVPKASMSKPGDLAHRRGKRQRTCPRATKCREWLPNPLYPGHSPTSGSSAS